MCVELKRMFRLFSRLGSDGLKSMSVLFRQELDGEGWEIIQESIQTNADFDRAVLVRKLLEMQDKYDWLVKKVFQDSGLFYSAMKQAFEAFVNREIMIEGQRILMADIIAQFTDIVLRGGSNSGGGSGREHDTNESHEDLFAKVVMFLKYVQDMDFFGMCFRELLAKRLLDKIMDEEAERVVIAKLKNEFGGTYTQKMETIVMDRVVSNEVMRKFQAWTIDQNRILPVSFDAIVLTSGSWPSMLTDTLIPPDEIVDCMESFKQFYASIQNNRKLTWIHTNSTAILNSKFNCGKRELSMTAYQATICLLFNHADRWTVNQLIQATQFIFFIVISVFWHFTLFFSTYIYIDFRQMKYGGVCWAWRLESTKSFI